MQFARALVSLVCASYALATTCAWCAKQIEAVPLSNKCYKENALGDGGGETVCLYEEKIGVPTGASCTYDDSGSIIRSSSVGLCADTVPVDSNDCPACLG